MKALNTAARTVALLFLTVTYVAGAQPTSGGALEAWSEFAPTDDDPKAQSLFTNCRRVAVTAHLLGDGDPQTLLPDLARTLDVMLRSRLTAARIYAEAPDLPHGLVLRLYVTVGDDNDSPSRLYSTNLEGQPVSDRAANRPRVALHGLVRRT